MAWKVNDLMQQRKEFIKMALEPNVNFTRLCERFEITPKTGYKWLARYASEGEQGLADRSRRPHSSPKEFADQTLIEALTALRKEYPDFGPRKLHCLLKRAGHTGLPAPSTITEILRRCGLIDPAEALKHKPFTSFERERPNELWQMDFKGHFPLTRSPQRCHPLVVLDDHSRYCLGLFACSDEQTQTVQGHLTALFRRAGLPQRILADNGSPWGCDGEHRWNPLAVWLARLGVGLGHGRPYHPQTQGKVERFNRTLKRELLRRVDLADLHESQSAFERFAAFYNQARPHASLDLETPASRWRPSERAFPETLPPVAYEAGETVRKVQQYGVIHYRGRTWRALPHALAGQPVALRHDPGDEALVQVFFLSHRVGQIDLRQTRGAHE